MPHAAPNTYACRSLWLPGSSVESPPDFIQNELFNSPASSEGWISLNGKVLADHPGQYILTVSAFSGWCVSLFKRCLVAPIWEIRAAVCHKTQPRFFGLPWGGGGGGVVG